MSAALSRMVEFFEIFAKSIALFFDAIFQVFALIPQWLTFLRSTIAFLPDIVVPFVVAGLFVSVVFLIIGRGS